MIQLRAQQDIDHYSVAVVENGISLGVMKFRSAAWYFRTMACIRGGRAETVLEASQQPREPMGFDPILLGV